MTLDLQDPDGGSEKLGQICAVFSVQPKNFEDRQEVFEASFFLLHILTLSLDFTGSSVWSQKSLQCTSPDLL